MRTLNSTFGLNDLNGQLPPIYQDQNQLETEINISTKVQKDNTSELVPFSESKFDFAVDCTRRRTVGTRKILVVGSQVKSWLTNNKKKKEVGKK